MKKRLVFSTILRDSVYFSRKKGRGWGGGRVLVIRNAAVIRLNFKVRRGGKKKRKKKKREDFDISKYQKSAPPRKYYTNFPARLLIDAIRIDKSEIIEISTNLYR